MVSTRATGKARTKSRCCAGSTSKSSAERWSPWWEPAARARARSCTCSGCSTHPTREKCCSTANGSTTVAERQRDQLRNGTFGFIFQFYHLLPELTALENVLMPQLIRHGLWSYWRERGRLKQGRDTTCSTESGSGTVSPICPSELSGGEMQRAAIARALAGRPKVLLADEPTGNLDAGNGQGVLELLRDLNRERGLTMILVTHDQQIAQQADRVVRLAEGRIEEWSPHWPDFPADAEAGQSASAA